MNSFFLYPAGENLKNQSDKHALVINDPTHNMNEGSEFLDDAIRMKELPLIENEVDLKNNKKLSHASM